MKNLGKALWALSDAADVMAEMKEAIISDLVASDDPESALTISELQTLRYGFAGPVSRITNLAQDFEQLVNDIENYEPRGLIRRHHR